MNNSLKFNTIKCCIVGSCNVGKTSIIQKYISKKNGLTDTTLGAIYWLIEHTSKSGIKFKIDFWDTAGQERYNSLIPMYSRNSDIIILVFDITDRNSFLELNKWVKIIKEHNTQSNIVLVGNKFDREFFRRVHNTEIKQFITDNFNDNIIYLETSANSGFNIDILFQKIFDLAECKLKLRDSNSQSNKLEFKILDNDENYYKCCSIL